MMNNSDKIFFDKVLDIVCEYYRIMPSELSLSNKKAVRAKMMMVALLRSQGYACKQIAYLTYEYISSTSLVYNYSSQVRRYILAPEQRGTEIHSEYVHLHELMIDYAGIVA